MQSLKQNTLSLLWKRTCRVLNKGFYFTLLLATRLTDWRVNPNRMSLLSKQALFPTSSHALKRPEAVYDLPNTLEKQESEAKKNKNVNHVVISKGRFNSFEMIPSLASGM